MKPFFEALRQGDVERVRTLLDRVPEMATARDLLGRPTILVALQESPPEAVDAVLGAIDPTEAGLAEAIVGGWIDRLEALLEADPASRERPLPDGRRPLGLACWIARPDVVETLLRHGADPDRAADDPTRERPLHAAAAAVPYPPCDPTAAAKTIVATLDALLRAGASVEALQAGGYEPLHRAAATGRVAVVERLLAAGADRDAEADDGRTAADLARERGHDAVDRLLAGG